MESLRKAINEMCVQCIYDPINGYGPWRQQVENCMKKDCPLYDVRPMTDKTKDLIRQSERRKAKIE